MMKMNVWDLCVDATQAMRLRYRPFAELYFYGLPVFVVVMLAVGVANAMAYAPILGHSWGAFAFGLVAAVTRWLILTRAVTDVLHYKYGSPKIPFLGYTLATEALVIPTIFMLPFQELAPLVGIWTAWAAWAQLAGFAVVSRQTIWRVLLAYVVYWLVSGLLISIFLAAFISDGLLNEAEIVNNLNEFLQVVPK
ncbi:hypothetical protein [Kingella negevensis]|uniref:hypothetical protein n=2 Tax=Kingella negevensis TaxID=1522312 RepID=UPI00050A02EF|nr:hypothetical protein [Kingella negevensis]MDK4688131.1 hypothetical protein [Kingella negevensis]WII90883.1 hypothetical protein QEO93_10860 [Kingella negevensis]